MSTQLNVYVVETYFKICINTFKVNEPTLLHCCRDLSKFCINCECVSLDSVKSPTIHASSEDGRLGLI